MTSALAMKTPLLLLSLAVFAAPAPAGTLELRRSIPLPGVTGKLDHSSLDPAGGRLFLSAWAQDAVEVIDLRRGRVSRVLGGMAAPQGVLYVPELDRLYVANEKDGSLRVLDGRSYAPLASIPLGEDADNIRYDARANRIYVGYEAGFLAVLDAATNAVLEKVALKAHPEAFALARRSGSVFLNTPDARSVTVYDRAGGRVVAEWPMGAVGDNFTVALDETAGRVFVGSRKPPFLLVLAAEDGREVARLPLHGNADDCFYDARRRRVYASCGEGYIDVFAQDGPDRYALLEAVRTAPGGRTCAFDGDTLYLNVQAGAGLEPEVRCYAVLP